VLGDGEPRPVSRCGGVKIGSELSDGYAGSAGYDINLYNKEGRNPSEDEKEVL